ESQSDSCSNAVAACLGRFLDAVIARNLGGKLSASSTAQARERFAKRTDLFLAVCRCHGDAQSRRAFLHGRVTTRRHKQSFIPQRGSQIERAPFIADYPRKNSTAIS